MTQPHYWLMKSEPDECSIDDALAAPQATVPWTGVRNYQARNFMRDAMQVGDGVLFYHSSCAEPGVVGIARVASGTRVDPTQFDPASPLCEARRSTLLYLIYWFAPDVYLGGCELLSPHYHAAR